MRNSQKNVLLEKNDEIRIFLDNRPYIKKNYITINRTEQFIF